MCPNFMDTLYSCMVGRHCTTEICALYYYGSLLSCEDGRVGDGVVDIMLTCNEVLPLICGYAQQGGCRLEVNPFIIN